MDFMMGHCRFINIDVVGNVDDREATWAQGQGVYGKFLWILLLRF